MRSNRLKITLTDQETTYLSTIHPNRSIAISILIGVHQILNGSGISTLGPRMAQDGATYGPDVGQDDDFIASDHDFDFID